MESSSIRNVIVLGTGPAGLTAALYSARARLSPLVLHGETPGGQLTTTTIVENFPGFVDGIDGNELVDNITKQSERFGTSFEYGTVAKVEPGKPIKLHMTDGKIYQTHSLIIATGAKPRKLGLPSETLYWGGKGVTSCATCDGAFFKDQDVCVIGGGDSAMEEAMFLTRFATTVYLIHRRDTFRASKIMSDRVLKHPKIKLVLNSGVEEIVGDGKKVLGVRVKDLKANTEKVIPLSGVFLAIGHLPNSDFLKGVVGLDAEGYVVTRPHTTYTNVPGVFACGDVVDKTYRQAITAAGTGCQAAIDAERWLEGQNH